jgi:hypothetical protein
MFSLLILLPLPRAGGVFTMKCAEASGAKKSLRSDMSLNKAMMVLIEMVSSISLLCKKQKEREIYTGGEFIRLGGKGSREEDSSA